ncbi:MAG: D-glycero-beta-D-manno-heptose 1,7-bisphosphate 7-phosphatase [Synergistaceae bacterium]|nr:D-glycero-beta-D-manno-heptose 1,7-bisphosphate 7-phosphatase [Synergistaceae bacterium]
MGNKAVFLDRDGTINADKNYLYRAEDFEFLPGAVEALRMLQSHGFLLIIITNQSGIARGYYTENDFLSLTEWMLERLKESGVNIAKVYYCPHLPDAKIPEYRKICDCRKPETGLFEEAAREFDVDMAVSFAVGDKMRDCSVCEKTECRGFIIGGNSASPKIRNVSSLLEAAKIITGS